MKEDREIDALDEYSKKLLTRKGFIDRYFEMKHFYLKNSDAYEAVERQYISLTGARKYKSYDSFKTIFLRKVKKGNIVT